MITLSTLIEVIAPFAAIIAVAIATEAVDRKHGRTSKREDA